jgi:D-alanyl-D-alanine carboxypeptidase
MVRLARRGLAVVAAAGAVLSMGTGPSSAATRHPVVPVRTTVPKGPPVPTLPRSWILVDLDTGRVLDQRDAHTRRRPASTIKLLAALTAEQRLRPGSRVSVSALAASMPANDVGLVAGDRWPLQQILDATLAVSANDAAVALAEQSGGSLDGFAAQMRRTAAALHVVDRPRLDDPSGLDDSSAHGGGDWVSAWDLALIGRAASADARIAAIARQREIRFTDPAGHPHRLINHNKLLSRFAGATGLKTGYTRASGNTLVATATRGGRTMLVVVLDAPDLYNPVMNLFQRGFVTAASAETGPRLAPPLRTSHVTPRRAVASIASKPQLSLVDRRWPFEVAALGLALALALLWARRTARR